MSADSYSTDMGSDNWVPKNRVKDCWDLPPRKKSKAPSTAAEFKQARESRTEPTIEIIRRIIEVVLVAAVVASAIGGRELLKENQLLRNKNTQLQKQFDAKGKAK